MSDFSVLKYHYWNISYSVNILSECLHIPIECSQLSKTYYNVLFGSSTRDRHDAQSADVQRMTLNASCMTISGERIEQLDIFCRDTGFRSDFLSFIDVELIRFFHGALQLYFSSAGSSTLTCDIFKGRYNSLFAVVVVRRKVVQKLAFKKTDRKTNEASHYTRSPYVQRKYQ